MGEIRDDISRLGDFADASAEQVQEARDTRAEIEEKLGGVRARFDVLAASRIDDDIDTDPVSDTDIDITEEECYEKAQEVLEATDPLHFPASFPEVFDTENPGFDVVVGNPPWEKAKLERHEFWARHYPGLRGLSSTKREERIDELENERPDLVEELKREKLEEEKRAKMLTEGPYPGIGGGDPDMYVAFCWRFWHLVSKKGHVGVVLPRSAFVGPATEQFRKKILEESVVKDITFLVNNQNWIFSEVHPQYTIALTSFKKETPSDDTPLPLRGPFPSMDAFEKGVNEKPHYFDQSRAKHWTDSSSFPLLPAVPETGEVFGVMARHPRLDSDGEWTVVPNTELHSTQDKKKDDGTQVMHFTDDPPDDYWPIFKGGSFNIWEPDTGVRYGWADPGVMIDYVQEKRENSYQYAGSRSPFSDMPEEWVNDRSTLSCFEPRLAFRDVARSTDTRTCIPSLLPPEVFLVEMAPYFIWPSGDERDEAYLLGIMSSIPFDWYVRRFVETHLKYHILNALPVPRPGRNDELRQRVTEISGRLAAVDDRYKDWADTVGVEYGPIDDEMKQEKIYELDAVVAHLYGLTREHVEVIFETFHDGWNYEERLERVLDYYASWADRLDLDHTDREAERAAGTRSDD
jgi:hypothetical protein